MSAAPYQVRTSNPSGASENRIHSDAVARQYGFQGGLVPGVTVFGHMTVPVLERFGTAWLERGWAEVSFGKPAYEGDLLTVNAAEGRTAAMLALRCANEDGLELAQMEAGLGQAATPDRRAATPPAAPLADRPEVTWDLMEIGAPFPALHWRPTPQENRQWCDDLRDGLAAYRDGGAPFLHPGLVLRQANNALKNRFVLPAWIHTGSRITFHRPLRAGSAYEIRAVPEGKWQRKGHDLVRLYVAILGDDGVAAEILHTAIFRLRAGDA